MCIYLMQHGVTPFADDEVYIEENREEYVFADMGVLWRGTQTKPAPLLWEYGQVCHNHGFLIDSNVCLYSINLTVWR